MTDKIQKSQTKLSKEGFSVTLSSLIDKLVNSMALSYSSVIMPISEFVELTKIPYVVSDETLRIIKNELELNMQGCVYGMYENQELGTYQQFDRIKIFCELGIIASQLKIPYEIPRGLLEVLDFELYHFDFEEEEYFTRNFSILDLIYFAKINDISDKLKTKMINPLDERCIEKPIIYREATRDEVIARFEPISKEVESWPDPMDADNYSKYEILKEFLETGKCSIFDEYWKNEEGVVIYLERKPNFSPPRKAHTPQEVKKYLGEDLEKNLEGYCQKKQYEKATEIIYRRNRVKDFLESDIKIPSELVITDTNDFSSLDPVKIANWIENMVDNFDRNDLNSELILPLSLTKQEYKLYRTIKKTMEYVRRGILTYDTEEKRALLPENVFANLNRIARLALPDIRE